MSCSKQGTRDVQDNITQPKLCVIEGEKSGDEAVKHLKKIIAKIPDMV